LITFFEEADCLCHTGWHSGGTVDGKLPTGLRVLSDPET